MSSSAEKSIVIFDRRAFTGAGVADFLSRTLQGWNTRHFASVDELKALTGVSVRLAIFSYSSYDQIADLFDDMTRLRSWRQDIPTAVFGDPRDPAILRWMTETGLRGILSEFASQDVVSAAILLMAAGATYFPQPYQSYQIEKTRKYQIWNSFPGAAAAVPERGVDRTPSADVAFTRKEIDVLGGLVKGHPNKTIASQLSIAENTVKIHIRSILKKLGASNRTEAVVFAHRLGIFDY